MKAKEYRICIASEDSSGVVRFDGSRFDRYSRLASGIVVYCDSSVTKCGITSLLTEQDTAAGNPGGAFVGATFRGLHGPIRMFANDAWGCDRRDPETYRAQLEETRALCAENGIEWRYTAGSTIANLLMGIPDIRPGLPGRWRGIAIAGLHAGPIVHIDGGFRHGVHIDRRQAYCHAMLDALPCGPMYESEPDIELDGISYAECVVPDSFIVPPLPVTAVSGNVVYPVGRFRGVWHNDLLRYAAEHGVSVAPLRTIAWARKSRALVELASKVNGLPSRIRKPLYTRIWGKMAALGGWVGTLKQKGPRSIEIDGMWWEYKAADESTKARPYYRPDIAGAIVSRNLTEIMRAANSLRSVTALHVDAIWTSDIQGASRLLSDAIGGFKLEHVGRHRQYACGVYHTECDDGANVIGASGYKGQFVTVAEFRRWAEAQTGNYGRIWHSSPRRDDMAASSPLHLEPHDTAVSIPGTDPFEPVFWGKDDMLRKFDRPQSKELDV